MNIAEFQNRANAIASATSASVERSTDNDLARHKARIDGYGAVVMLADVGHDPAAVTATCERVLAAWAALHGVEVKP